VLAEPDNNSVKCRSFRKRSSSCNRAAILNSHFSKRPRCDPAALRSDRRASAG
jgi:hypothetical protein